MMDSLNDHNTFKAVELDETLSQKNKLIRKLKQLKKGFISEKEYYSCRSTGSQPTRIYDWPKVHNPRVPLVTTMVG